jgi:hypothetical protein
MAKRQPVVLENGAVKDSNNPTQMGRDPTVEAPPEPHLDPRVTSPQALAYAKAAAARRGAAATLPKVTTPVAGGPTPPIPRLDGEHRAGMTMSEQALQEAGRNLGAEAAAANPAFVDQTKPPVPGGIISGPAPVQTAAPGSGAAAGLLPQDMLPEQAQQDPNFQQGQGSMYASAQPQMARKYGVMRNGQYLPPQQLWPTGQGGRPALRPETVEGIKALEDFNKQRQTAEEGGVDQKIEQDSKGGVAGQSSDVKGAVGKKPMTDEERKELLNDMDEFDLTRFRDATLRDMLNNNEQREIIEARLKPLDIVDLIIQNRVSQVVPIIPNKFEPELQSYSGEEDLAIKRLIMEETKSLEPSDRYILDKYSAMGLTVALRSINKKQLPDYVDQNGDFDDKLFWVKFNIVVKFPFHMLASLAVNWFWFDMRVRRLFVAEQLGNG